MRMCRKGSVTVRFYSKPPGHPHSKHSFFPTITRFDSIRFSILSFYTNGLRMVLKALVGETVLNLHGI